MTLVLGLLVAAFVLFIAHEIGRERGYHEGWEAHRWSRDWVDRLARDKAELDALIAEIEGR